MLAAAEHEHARRVKHLVVEQEGSLFCDPRVSGWAFPPVRGVKLEVLVKELLRVHGLSRHLFREGEELPCAEEPAPTHDGGDIVPVPFLVHLGRENVDVVNV